MSYCFYKGMCYNSIRISADPKQFGGTTMIKLGEKIKSLRKQKNIYLVCGFWGEGCRDLKSLIFWVG